MVQEIKTYKTADLVLQVSNNYNPATLNIAEWDRFLDLLCSNRQYQKEAIIKSIIYMASGLYKSIYDLVHENWLNPKMVELKTRYNSIEEYISKLQMKDKMSATIDLATGTGKSYVIYGIAQIMLGLGIVDRVLVLCPSLTIEDGLMEKFRKLSEDPALLKSIPENSKIKNPSIKTAAVTIKEGDICIENIHAVYDRTGSSIKDSFGGNGANTLVLNDEAHHIFNPVDGRDNESKNIKKWKEFLLNPEFNFKYSMGFTGTAYIQDEYFNDVIYRYSLRQAVDDKMIKMVDYVSKNEEADDDIKFQEIYDNHQQNNNTYRKVKPLTILITRDISKAKQLCFWLIEKLAEKESLPIETCENKVLIVTSANEHKANARKLKEVDNKDNEVEWIVSVSMLTEGWDVKNVFQIVPMEDRAFNSKLLIAQVLGRGLRIPEDYQSPQPKVRVFNHDAWSRSIKGLVDEILEIEMRLISTSINTGDRFNFHFDLHQINYEKKVIEKESKKEHKEFDYTKGFIELQSQVEESEKDTEYTDLSGGISSKNTLILYNTYTIEWIVNKIHNELKLREWEGKILKLPTGDYSKEKLPPKEEIRKIIRSSMDRVGIKGDRLIEKNMHKILSSFNTLLRKSGKTTVYERKAKEPFIITTRNIERESIAVGNLRHNSTVFYSSNYATELEVENKEILNAVLEDESFPRSSSKEINSFILKTPLDLIFTKGEPERKFIELLCKNENAQKIEAWIKSRDMAFYSIEYSITSVGGKHSKIQSFNPDFFIKLKDKKQHHYIVLEIKADNDTSDDNKAKNKYAKLHFENLNAELKTKNIKEMYHFHFLSPSSYVVFFDHLRNGKLLEDMFTSELELLLIAEDE